MGYYKNATICNNGHTISSSESVGDKFCKLCGAKNITHCPRCGIAIRGTYEVPDVIVFGDNYTPPKYCYNCGEPFPWTQLAIESTKELILEDEQLSDIAKEKLTQSLPAVIVETPQTPLAATRVQKALISVSKFTADALRQFAIEFGCELVKKQLGL